MALIFKKEKRNILNFKTLLVALVVLILLIGAPAFAGGEGRYQGIAMGDKPLLWIVDTKTGQVRYCLIDKNNTTTCGTWSPQ